MRHVYECPVRWADLDLLGHVNNVVYVDYLQEARVDMLRVHAPDRRVDDLAEGVVVVRHEVSYLAPLDFRFRPVRIECWVTEIRAASFTIAYEVVDDTDSGRTTYLRATTVLTPYVFGTERPRRLTDDERAGLQRFYEPGERVARAPRPVVPRRPEAHYDMHVRFSDVDVYGHVNNVKYFEYFQEARIAMMSRLAEGLTERAVYSVPGSGGLRSVVAQIDVDYHVPILFRRDSYDLWTQVERVGTTSMTLVAEICDGETVLSRARVVVVFWDSEAQRPTRPPEALRERLVALSDDPGSAG
ncbi:acyl-CoA thioesterase [Nocardioides sp.]|uniref:acyl-CoA thioesterase n=1 Tax=Nocardioides sp. TaxID=35761 RepID=UPI0035284F09